MPPALRPGTDQDAAEPMPAPDEEEMKREREAVDRPDSEPRPNDTDLEKAEQKIIRNAELTLDVPEPEDAMDDVTRLAQDMNGYVSDASMQTYADRRPRIQMTIRMPEENFDAFNQAVRDLGTITFSRIWSSDVTEEYIDLEAQLENLKSEEVALRRILEEATTVEDMLNVRRELNEVRSRIDSIQGRLRYLDDRVSLSTFQLTIRPEDVATTAIRVTGFDNFGSRLLQSLIQGSNWVLRMGATSILMFVRALPGLVVLIILVIVGRFVFRRIRQTL